jgi:hypothetical protein
MRKPFNEAMLGRTVPDFDHFLSAPAGAFTITGQLDGLHRLIVYQKIDNLPLIISVAPTTKTIFAHWRRKALITMGLIVGLAATAAWLMFWLVSEVRRRTEAEQRHKQVAEAEREARAALERSMAQVEESVREQMRVQRALRESESRFRDFAGSCGDWFWETGSNHRYTHYVGNTPAAEEALPADPIGKTPWQTSTAIRQPTRIGRSTRPSWMPIGRSAAFTIRGIRRTASGCTIQPAASRYSTSKASLSAIEA